MRQSIVYMYKNKTNHRLDYALYNYYQIECLEHVEQQSFQMPISPFGSLPFPPFHENDIIIWIISMIGNASTPSYFLELFTHMLRSWVWTVKIEFKMLISLSSLTMTMTLTLT